MRVLQILLLIVLAISTLAWEEAVLGKEEEDSNCIQEELHCKADADCCSGLACDSGVCKAHDIIEKERQLTGSTCAFDSAQCGGKNWTGPKFCCGKNSKCYYRNEYYSKCAPRGSLDNAPKCKNKGQQCGGRGYKGSKTCCTGLTCKKKSATYSSCVANKCVPDNSQCGGKSWKGDTKCCNPNSVCTVRNEYYSKCAPKTGPTTPPTSPPTKPPSTPTPTTEAPDSKCAVKGKQCGGQDWDGATCCKTGLVCVYTNKWYSQCRDPLQCAYEEEQCGGEGWKGPTCCIPGYVCKYIHKWYSQCQRPKPTAKPTTAAPTDAKPTAPATTAGPTTPATTAAVTTAAATTAGPTTPATTAAATTPASTKAP